MAGIIGKTIGAYELLELIGDGGQSRVFKARCISRANPRVGAGETVAIKVLRSCNADLIVGRRFQELADALLKAKHAHIVKYHDFFIWPYGDWEEVKCVVMEFLRGETLQERLRKCPEGLSWEEVKAIFNPCLSALVYARALGLTHRDIKPSNIFLGQDGAVKLIDFEVARPEGRGETSLADFKGSPDYMAPDFLTMGDFHGDETSDVFSLGVTLYQMLTGRLPFPPLGANAFAGYISRWHKQARPEPVFSDGIFRVLPQAAPLIRQSLQPDRLRRYQTIAEMQAAFQAVQYLVVQAPQGDKYELCRLIGRGGFGEVFLARRLADNRRLAVKRLFTAQEAGRFAREAGLLKENRHSHIVEFVDSFIVEEFGQQRYFLVMEYLEGMPGATLRDRLKQRQNGLDAGEVIELFIHYLEGLRHLHARGIIHRDIKPGNLYAPEGFPENAKILDLGVARDLRGTITFGQIPGTLDYMAPEFADAESDRGSPQSDLYSLGLALFEALTGRPPFPKLPENVGEAYTHFMARKERKPNPVFDDDVFKHQPAWIAVFQKALAWEPRARFRGADEIRKLLLDFLPLGHPKKALLEAGHNDQAEELNAEDTRNKNRPDSEITRTLRQSDIIRPAAPSSARVRPPAGKRKTLIFGLAAGLMLTGALGVYYLRHTASSYNVNNANLPGGSNVILPMLPSNHLRQSSSQSVVAENIAEAAPGAALIEQVRPPPVETSPPPEESEEEKEEIAEEGAVPVTPISWPRPDKERETIPAPLMPVTEEQKPTPAASAPAIIPAPTNAPAGNLEKKGFTPRLRM